MHYVSTLPALAQENNNHSQNDILDLTPKSNEFVENIYKRKVEDNKRETK